MSDYAVSDIMAHINDFSYDERKSLFQALKASLKRKPKRIRLTRGKTPCNILWLSDLM